MRKLILNIILLFTIIGCTFSQETYKVGKTEYYNNQYYSTTGKPLVKRSETNKMVFLRSQGYKSIPKGYEVDHIIPLSEGGTDDPNNMQLITKGQHLNKTSIERTNRSNSTSTYNSAPQFNSTSTQNSNTNYSTPSTNNTRTIQTGSRGGQYYINSNGNKTYIKK